MKHPLLLLCVLLSALLGLSCTKTAKQQQRELDTYVVVLSADGFRADYPQHHATPSLDRMAAMGLKSSLIPCFPSLTFPNHYSMATGLYPAHHGIIANRFIDPKLGRYSIGDRKTVEDPAFYAGEPVWNTAERQGIRSASYFWVGSETPIGGGQPTDWYRYNGKVPYKERADQVISWLQRPEKERPHLIMWYLDEPDHTGHHHGPYSQELDQQVRRVDSVIGYFLDQLEQLPIAEKVNFIVVSDHGMEACLPGEHAINLSHYMDKDLFREVIEGVPTLLYTPEENVEKAMAALQKVPHVKAYRRSEIPARFHYSDSERLPEIMVLPEPGTYLYFRQKDQPLRAGAHGYDNALPAMHAIFYAVGPAFAAGSTHAPFPNITLYPLICELLGIEPAPNDADPQLAKALIVPQGEKP